MDDQITLSDALVAVLLEGVGEAFGPAIGTERDHAVAEAGHDIVFGATRTDGSRTAIMVKSAYRYSQSSVAEELRLIASQVDTRFADQVVVMTEKHFNRWEFYNAEMMHEMRWPDPVVDSAARRAVHTLVGAVRISELVEVIGHGGNGFRAIVRLIRNRYLAVTDGVRISHAASVSRCNNDA